MDFSTNNASCVYPRSDFKKNLMQYSTNLVAMLLAANLAQSSTSNNPTPIVYSACDPSNFPLRAEAAAKTELPIVQVTKSGGSGPVSIAGYVLIKDGCNFSVNNFTYLGADESFWYGAWKGNTDGILASDTYIYASGFPTTYSYALTNDAGNTLT